MHEALQLRLNLVRKSCVGMEQLLWRAACGTAGAGARWALGSEGHLSPPWGWRRDVSARVGVRVRAGGEGCSDTALQRGLRPLAGDMGTGVVAPSGAGCGSRDLSAPRLRHSKARRSVPFPPLLFQTSSDGKAYFALKYDTGRN